MLFNNQVETTVKIITKILILHGLSYFLCDTLCKNFIISRRFTQIGEQIDANILRAPWRKTFFAFVVKNKTLSLPERMRFRRENTFIRVDPLWIGKNQV